MDFVPSRTALMTIALVLVASPRPMEAIKWRVEPRDQVVFQGSTVTLNCALPSLRVKGDVMHWLYTPDGSTQQIFLSSNNEMASEMDPSKVSRYNFQSSAGNFHLSIYNADAADNGLYTCMIYNKVATRRAVSGNARVNVVPRALPEGSPVCSISPMHPQPGDQVFFTCSSLASFPVSILKWSKGNVDLPSTVSIIQENLRKTATLTKTLTGVDNHAEYVCSESWPVVGSVKSYCRISPFDIPINVSISPSNIDISVAEINKEILFTCKAKAYPPTVYYKWFFDGYQVTQYPDRFTVLDGGKKLRISQVIFDSDRNFVRNPMEIRCNVGNSMGEIRTANAHLRILSSTAHRKDGGGRDDKSQSDEIGSNNNSNNAQTKRMNRLLLTMIVLSSMILCALVALLVVCSKRHPTQIGLKMDGGELEDTTNILDVIDISSPLGSITSSIEYSKPLKTESHKRHSSYTPLFKEKDLNDIASAAETEPEENEEEEEEEERDTHFMNENHIATDSIYENATRFSLPELPGLPLTRLDGRSKMRRDFRKEKVSM